MREAADVLLLKDLIKKAGCNISVIAKIEKPQALNHIDAIMDASDGIMVARGDLGVELTPEKVPVVQKRLIKRANEKGILVITATQMLESMIKNPCPTRAEASDVANAIFDNTDAVMLSGETASGSFPVEVVKMMSRIIQESEKAITYPRSAASDLEDEPAAPPKEYAGYFPQTLSLLSSIGAREIDAKAVVVFTSSGVTAKRISKCRSNCRILALSPYPRIQREMALYWGVQPVIITDELNEVNNVEDAINKVDELLIKTGLFHKGDFVVIAAGSPRAVTGSTNIIKLHVLDAKDNLTELS